MVDFAKEISKGATTVSEKVSKTVTDVTSKVGGAGTSAALDTLKQAVVSAGANFSAAGLQLPGLDVFGGATFNSLVQSQKDLNLARGYDQGQTKSSPPPNFNPPLSNQLIQYASVNTIFTLSILTDEAINFPDLTYKKGQLGPIILKSANGAPAESMVKTAFGVYNFYLDDLKMTTIMGLNKTTGVTNATNVSFKVIEPYSMGLFFQALQVGAYESGYANYMDVPILLTIEWKGWTDIYKEESIVTRQIPIKLRELGMQVTGKGCEYAVEAYPWNEQGTSKTYNEVKTDIGIECDKGGPYTIQNLLQTGANSLQAVLNRRLQEAKKSGVVDVPDEILIIFPQDLTSDPSSSPLYSNELSEKSATTSPSGGNAAAFYGKLGVSQGANSTKVQGVDAASVNLIGQALLGFNEKTKGETPFAKDADSYDKEKGIVKVGSVTIDLNNSKFHFTQGALITDIITNVIVTSDYGRNALNPSQIKDGKVVWFRIENQVYNIPQEDGKVGRKPKCVVYRVVPFTVSASRFMPPQSKTPGEEQLKKQVLKEYNYIYTGKNIDILDFNIEFKAGFYTSLFADKGTKGEDKTLNAKTGQAADTKEEEMNNSMNSSSSYWGERNSTGTRSTANNPTQTRYDAIESETAKHGGAGAADDTATKVARQFHDAITNATDMINLQFTILGDPYYIADSGMGNYSAKEVQGYENITNDGTVNYQNGEVHITINFRTPIDIDLNNGSYDFRDTQPIVQFSGLYQVISVDSSVVKNKFTQTLSCIRLPGQDPKLEEKSIGNIVNNESSDYSGRNLTSLVNNQNNNVNVNAPNPGLPGVINSGGFTI